MTDSWIMDRFPDNDPIHPMGTLYAFVTADDPHSPVMLPRYRELADIAEKLGINYAVVDVREDPEWTPRAEFLLHSVPTLIWDIATPDEPSKSPLLRIVGIVNEKKLEHEFEKALNNLLS